MGKNAPMRINDEFEGAVAMVFAVVVLALIFIFLGRLNTTRKQQPRQPHPLPATGGGW